MTQSEFVGVDGCPCGWFSVGFNSNGDYELKAFILFGDLLDYYKAAKLILVDMPIGLPDGGHERPGDPEARKRLGQPRGSSVFRAPTRQALKHLVDEPNDKDGTKDVQIKITGKSLSSQSLSIMPKIHEVDQVMLAPGSNARSVVREVHPEICFWALNNENAMKHKKGARGETGIAERIRVLTNAKVEPRAQDIFDAACGQFFRKCVAKDDILDALVAAVTAKEGWTDGLQTLPATPPTDKKGLPMEMVFWKP